MGKTLTAIEVKSGRSQEHLPGMEAFANEFKPTRLLLVGGDGIAVKVFYPNPLNIGLVLDHNRVE